MRKRRNPGGRRLSAVLALAAALIVSGCNPTHTSYGENNPHGANGDDNAVNRDNHYPQDGYLGTTHSYPRIPGHRLTLNAPARAGSMRDAIRGVTGVTGSNITFQGRDAYVTLRLHPDVRDVEVPRVERQVASVLRFNFPRYTIHVTSLP